MSSPIWDKFVDWLTQMKRANNQKLAMLDQLDWKVVLCQNCKSSGHITGEHKKNSDNIITHVTSTNQDTGVFKCPLCKVHLERSELSKVESPEFIG